MGRWKQDTLMERFWSKVTKDSASGCWLWGGATDYGYGVFMEGPHGAQKKHRAHRFLFERMNGPIGGGHVCCHSCDNRACVNPDHIFLGTQAQNMADMVKKGRQRRGSEHHNARLREDDIVAIRRDTREQAEIARSYGVSQVAVSMVKLRKTWKHVA